MLKNGYVKICTISPKVSIANPMKNAQTMIDNIKEDLSANIYVFPELSLTGYSCNDLFFQNQLYEDLNIAIKALIRFSKNEEFECKLIVVGMPIKVSGKIYNCAVYIQNGKILSAIPKTNITPAETRWFAAANTLKTSNVTIIDQKVPIGQNILLKDIESNLTIGTEIGQDLLMPISPACNQVLNGANLVINIAAMNNVVSASKYQKDLISVMSKKLLCGYVFANAGLGESTTNVVYSGHSLIAENGDILAEAEYENNKNIAVVDIEKLDNRRNKERFNINCEYYNIIEFETGYEEHTKKVKAYPFVCENSDDEIERCNEIIKIQTYALTTRLEKTGIKKIVIGVSGGSDSTLALLIAREAFNKLHLPMENIIGVTMPGFGTSKKTLNNSLDLMRELEITQRNISIVPACKQHLKDIKHSENDFDITFENVQARERTQLLFDIANQENALVLGTGDMSELALGWCTYNGDHMSNYCVNSNIPKTAIKPLLRTFAKRYRYNGINELAKILYDIIDTPISPELLPLDENGDIAQKTEQSIGKYDLHDFFLYHYVGNNFSNEKIKSLTYEAFKNVSKEEIDKTFETFIKRFKTQQFKRNCSPDGPTVGSISISSTSGWIMPSDIG